MTSTKRRRRKDARPAEILEAAFAAFAEHGYHATRLDDVAARAGVVKGTLYRYFDGKEALFREAVRSRLGAQVDAASAAIDAHQGPTDALLSHVITALHAGIEDPSLRVLMRIVIAEGPRFPDLVALYHREAVGRMTEVMERIVARGVARGEFAEGAATALPMVIAGPGVMAAIWRMTFQDVAPVDAAAVRDAHIDLVLNGLRRRDLSVDEGAALRGASGQPEVVEDGVESRHDD